VPSTLSDITLAVGDGARRMTYAELADVRGISAASAERLVRRRRWPRQAGNDGVVRVLVPLTEARNHKEHATSDVPPDNDTDVRTSSRTSPLTSAPDIPLTVRTLESAVEALREQLVKANQWAEAEHAQAERAELRAEADRARADVLQAALGEERRRVIEILTADRRRGWRRWFR
jgi:hypothetical protein